MADPEEKRRHAEMSELLARLKQQTQHELPRWKTRPTQEETTPSTNKQREETGTPSTNKPHGDDTGDPGDSKRSVSEPARMQDVELPPRPPTPIQLPQVRVTAPDSSATAGDVTVNYNVNVRSSSTMYKKQRIEPERKEVKAEGLLQNKLLDLCTLLAGQAAFNGKIERVWKQTIVATSSSSAAAAPAMRVTRESFEQTYMQLLTPEGAATIRRALDTVRRINVRGEITLTDLLRSPDLWTDFVGLAAKQKALDAQQTAGGAGRYFTGVAYGLTSQNLAKIIQQHLFVFASAVRDEDDRWVLRRRTSE